MNPVTNLKQQMFRLRCAADNAERKHERCNLNDLEAELLRVEHIAHQARMAVRDCIVLAAMSLEEVKRGH